MPMKNFAKLYFQLNAFKNKLDAVICPAVEFELLCTGLVRPYC